MIPWSPTNRDRVAPPPAGLHPIPEPMSSEMRVLVDTPAVRIVLDAAGAVSMFVVLGAIAGSRDTALTTTPVAD
ncbi:hypothetical protein CH298_26735 [Rhodococcoides fascians]|nr:hypothetical protein CH263_08690 [Rhodococcus sp. 06-1059B-a]OZE81366.1 hypothetical protein CH303_27275 [Rhodococcus fascians]OZF10190.1 hypothetical protein CH298_26735 [Rhodococcus fascians]OZF13280.1 hypothetical protein CH297_27025 [Rhodococcus fascians]OZF59378.1 hypothetical protein CH308_27475 [Rhodococcus fascians]